MVTGKTRRQRWLHTFVGYLRGRENSCLTQKRDGSFAPKIDYKSQESAARSAEKLTEKWGRAMDAYQCWFCKGWHIGNAANLTVGKFFSILRVWIIKKKRAGNKARLKPRNYEVAMDCDRCHKPTHVKIMSMFNTQEICMECKVEEKQDPRYAEAVAADEAAIKSGNYNFKGIGL
jgi:hypothetical protein